jgi:hypothetical protein
MLKSSLPCHRFFFPTSFCLLEFREVVTLPASSGGVEFSEMCEELRHNGEKS